MLKRITTIIECARLFSFVAVKWDKNGTLHYTESRTKKKACGVVALQAFTISLNFTG
jgi:hypothetical protein